MPMKPKQDGVLAKGATKKQVAKARTTLDAKPSRKQRESYCYASSRDEGERWTLHSVRNNRTYEDAMFTQGWPELFGQPDVVWFTPPMTRDNDKPAANMVAGLWGGCVNRMIRALLEQIQEGLALRDGLVVPISGAKIKLAAVEWHNRSFLEMLPLAPLPRAPWEHSDQIEGNTMSGKGRQQSARKPATKFAHLRKKMDKAKLVTKMSKKK